MLSSQLNFLVCPISKAPLNVMHVRYGTKLFDGEQLQIIDSAVLTAESGWFYPVIDGIPRMQVEAFLDYENFLSVVLPDYITRKEFLLNQYNELIKAVIRKNKKTKQSFEAEWNLFNYEEDKVWQLEKSELLTRFLKETGETVSGIRDKLIFDAGCGNGLLDSAIAEAGATVFAMDFSRSVDRGYRQNANRKVFYIQGDIEYSPFRNNYFDIIHCSGVLIHTPDPEKAFGLLDRFLKDAGKMSIWLYHPRKDRVHNSFNFLRRFTSKLPLNIQYNLYRFTLYPLFRMAKGLKGKKENKREMMVAIMDWFSPEFRWEFSHNQARNWFNKRSYRDIEITTEDVFGFNITGIKQKTVYKDQ